FSFKVGAADPSPVDQAAGFAYRVDWGDGTPYQTLPAMPSNGSGTLAGHVFNEAGPYTIRLSATDKDGGTSDDATYGLKVNPDSTTISVTSSTAQSVWGQNVIFTATVSADAPGSGSPTGVVTFYDDGSPL